ncbi:MAG: DUF1127 domain-containing protein [Pseudomonadota bacterium]
MATLTRFVPTGPASASAFRVLGNAIVTLVKAVARWYTNRRQTRLLLEMDDRMLSDIGLTRGDVRAALRTAGTIPPLERLRLIAVEKRATARALAADRLNRSRRKPGRAPHLAGV